MVIKKEVVNLCLQMVIKENTKKTSFYLKNITVDQVNKFTCNA